MSGFSLVDSAYYERPGVKMAGWLALHLSGELGVGLLADGYLHFAPPSVECKSLASLLDRLRQEHEPDHWYRGQIGTRTCRYEGSVELLSQAFPEIDRLRISFDGLIPSAFRFVTSSSPAVWDESGARLRPPLDPLSSALRSLLRASNARLREIAMSFFKEAPILAIMPWLAMQNVTPSRDLAEFHPGTNILRSYLRLIALAQHYEHGSSMVDVTRSPEIAAWFASHTWADDQPTGSRIDGFGSIYRFRGRSLERMITDELLWAKGTSPWIQGLGLFGIVDISSFDRCVAARPAAQMGGSVLGLENSVMYFLMGAYSIGEVFTFPHSSVTGAESKLSKDDLCPSDDPANEIVRKTDDDQTPISAEELGSLLSAAGMTSSEVDHIVTLRAAKLL